MGTEKLSVSGAVVTGKNMYLLKRYEKEDEKGCFRASRGWFGNFKKADEPEKKLLMNNCLNEFIQYVI